MAKWDKTTAKSWANSEVAKEFEQSMIKSAIALAEQTALKAEAQAATQKLKEVADNADKASKSLEGTNKQLKEMFNNTEDPVVEPLPGTEEEPLIISPEETILAKKELLDALIKMSYSAADSGNTKLAYKIERVIQIIEELE